MINDISLDGYIGVLVYPNEVAQTDDHIVKLGVLDHYYEWMEKHQNVSLNEYLKSCLKKDELPTETRHVHNLIVTTGRTQIMKLLTGESTTYWRYIGIGSNNTAPTTGDTALAAQIGSRKEIAGTTGITSGTTGRWRAFFGSAENNHAAVVEAGNFDASSSGNMKNRQIFTAIDHSASANNTLTIVDTLTQS